MTLTDEFSDLVDGSVNDEILFENKDNLESAILRELLKLLKNVNSIIPDLKKYLKK